jgi:hypothetical protein
MDHASRPWGEDSIRLELPSSLVTIDGLSREQQRTIARDYASFVVGRNEASREADMVCRAGRLEQPLALPPEQFAINGQYAPLIRRTGAKVAITGFDFLGHLDRGGSAPTRAALAVAKEEELARSFVLENFLRLLLAHHVLDRCGVLLHSAGVLYRDRAYLFSGRSNAGKTTLARKAAAAGARVLSDDINLVIPGNGVYRVHKVPFTGEFGRRAENRSGCGSFPLGGLALLEKAPALTAAPVRPAEGVAGLISGCPFVNDDPEEFPALLEVLTQLVSRTPIVRLGVARDDPFEAVMGTLLRHCEHV